MKKSVKPFVAAAPRSRVLFAVIAFCSRRAAEATLLLRLRFVAFAPQRRFLLAAIAVFTTALAALTVVAATPLLLQKSGERLLRVVLAAEKFVALDRGDYADGAFVARLGALHAAEAAHADRASQCDFVREGEKNFDRRAFPDVFGKKEVDTARTDVAGFGAGLPYGRASRPANRQG